MRQPKLRNKASTDHWGVRLRTVLREKSITLRKAASLAGVSASVVDSWTTGASPGDFHAVRRLSDSLAISFSWLLTGSREAAEQPTVTELFREVPWFDGYARVQISRLLPNETSNGSEDDDQ